MQRLCSLGVVLVSVCGCWKGGPLREARIAFKHDSIVWVYEAGGQIGRWGILFVPDRNELLALEPGENCVYVREGQTGGQCSATPQANLQLTHALDVKTGRAALFCRPVAGVDRPELICRADRGHWEALVEDGLSVYSAGETGRLYLRLPREILVLEVTYEDPEVRYKPWLGVPIAILRMPDDLLVVGLSQGYVVCIDLKKVRASPQGGNAE